MKAENPSLSSVRQRSEKIDLGFTLVAKYSHLLILTVLIIVLTISVNSFFTSSNLINVLRQSSMLLIMGLGMTAAMLLGRGVDMSIGAILSMSSCVAAGFLRATESTGSIVLGIAIALSIGAVMGLLNGVLIAYLDLPAILVTYGMREILRGVTYLYMDGGVVVNLHPAVLFTGSGWLFNRIPMPIIIALTLTLVFWFILKRTAIGRRLYIVGANPVAARFSGIKVKRTIIFGFVLSGVMAAIAGIVYLGRLGSAEAEIGKDFAFQAISAVAIGGVSFNGGIGHVWGVVVGAIILNLITNSFNLLNISSSWQGFAYGLIIIVAVLLDYFVGRKQVK